jgi:hypothetical protein
MSFSYAIHCPDFDRSEQAGSEGGEAKPFKVVDGKAILCPLLVEKSLKSGIRLGQGPDTPVQ